MIELTAKYSQEKDIVFCSLTANNRYNVQPEKDLMNSMFSLDNKNMNGLSKLTK